MKGEKYKPLSVDDCKFILYNFHDSSKVQIFNQNHLVKNKKDDRNLPQIEDDFVRKISKDGNLRVLKNMINTAKHIINNSDTTADGLQKQIVRKREKDRRKRKLEASLERQRKRIADYKRLMSIENKVLVSDNKESKLKIYKITE
ncbi:Hypothetical protein SRAE_2000338900 [Strongyloides ratti]|uniref:Uncharacterized protein n=1 Tax=Strongyloides ratti TaxID=34506 RepID=A0A090MZD3_STRRB|nr:Hypothetical protein SRAE_2000338900 [Strongyloides ratti]CEF68734.1 Hypothetical protein SRAE_2000338900 [Strongyloides ratti]